MVVVLATSLFGCAHKPRRELDCRERIDECMDDCSEGHPMEQDSCYAGCRTLSCESTDEKDEAR